MPSTDDDMPIPMDAPTKSALGSLALALAMGVAGYAVRAGIVPAADQSTLAAVMVAVVTGLLGLVITWWKTRQVTQTAMIRHINASDNGVKVVSAAEPGIPVNKPLKGE